MLFAGRRSSRVSKLAVKTPFGWQGFSSRPQIMMDPEMMRLAMEQMRKMTPEQVKPQIYFAHSRVPDLMDMAVPLCGAL